MSDYVPKVGDRVRVVLEGEVTRVYTGRLLVGTGLFDNWIDPAADHVVSVEKVSPPLPTTPGSVIRQPHYSDPYKFWRYVRVFDGRWLSLESGDYYPSSEFGVDPDDIEVIFDAGRVTP